MFNIFGTRTPAQKAADPAAREQTRKRNAAVAQEKLQEMSKREEILTKKVQHTEKQIAAVKAEAQAKLKAGNKAGGPSEIARKHPRQAHGAVCCSQSSAEAQSSTGETTWKHTFHVG